jgi:hypothetical protein
MGFLDPASAEVAAMAMMLSNRTAIFLFMVSPVIVNCFHEKYAGSTNLDVQGIGQPVISYLRFALEDRAEMASFTA